MMTKKNQRRGQEELEIEIEEKINTKQNKIYKICL